MTFRGLAFLLLAIPAALTASAEIHVVDGKRYECSDGLCRLVDDDGGDAHEASASDGAAPRIAQGYMTAEEFVAFLENREAASPLAERGLWLTLLMILVGGLAMNLTPCVLPMVPINLIVIGRSAMRGAAYGLGMAVAYGALGVAAAFGGLAFGSIQANPWFNAAVAVVFAALSLSLLNVFFIDLSRFRPHPAVRQSDRRTIFFPFFMGALSAVLAGACVAPVLISVLLLTGRLYAEGHALAPALPFVLGLGMALPWPFLGAGLRVLPKPGAWMKRVNRLFALIVAGFAVYYGIQAWNGFRTDPPDGKSGGRVATPATLPSILSARRISKVPHPVLFDCGASWCKNCAAMERRVMTDPRVRRALEPYEVIRVRAEDIAELRKVAGFEQVRGLPAFVIFE